MKSHTKRRRENEKEGKDGDINKVRLLGVKQRERNKNKYRR
jgi:hypothetical protein